MSAFEQVRQASNSSPILQPSLTYLGDSPCIVLRFHVLLRSFSSFPAVPCCRKLKAAVAKIHGSTRPITSFIIVLHQAAPTRASATLLFMAAVTGAATQTSRRRSRLRRHLRQHRPQ